MYLPIIPSLDFWLSDFSTGPIVSSRASSNRGAPGSFDITGDGKSDRVRSREEGTRTSC